MAFNSRNTVVSNPVNQTSPEQTALPPIQSNYELRLEELEFLLKVLGNVDLKGHQVEMFYNLVIKLQNQYIQKTK
jgi:hypothetical protein